MAKYFGVCSSLLALVLASGAVIPAAHAVEALSTDELVAHCSHYEKRPGSKDGIFCVRYIQGFIDGAVVTDERVTMNVADDIGKGESFLDRALRTRLGGQIARYGPSYYAEFCLGEPVPLAEVVKRVIEDLNDPERRAESMLARVVVYHTLRDAYPCESADEP